MFGMMKSAMRRRRRVAHRAGVSARRPVLEAIAVRRLLRVCGPERALLVRRQRMAHVADRRFLPRHVLLALHHEAQVFLGGVRVLRVLEDHHREHEVELARLAVEPDREVRVLDVLRHLLQLRVLRRLRRVVHRDAVRGEEQLAVEERLVVVRVEPRQRAGNERLVQLLRVLERGDRLGAVDDDVVLGVDELAAVRPHEPVRPARVARRVAEREARRRALRLQRLAQLEEARHVARARCRSPRP